MTNENHTAERLKGNNLLIKFRDSEELFICYDYLKVENEAEIFDSLDRFLNNRETDISLIPGIAISRETIKYIKKI
jgi:hypothetical protein